MLRSNRSVINTAVRMMLVEGGCNDIIAEGCKIIREALAAEMDDEELMIPDDSDDIVVDGPEPGETMEQLNRETMEQPNGKRRKRKQEAAEPVTADSPSSDLSDRSVPSGSPSPSRVPALTSEQIRRRALLDQAQHP